MINSTIIYFHTDRSLSNLAETFLAYEDGTLHLNKSRVKLNFGPVDFLFSRNHSRKIYGEKVDEFPDGFISFRYIVIVVWEGLEFKPDAVNLARELILFFWNQNIPAVATGKLELLLPNAGGYNCEKLPWPDEEEDS